MQNEKAMQMWVREFGARPQATDFAGCRVDRSAYQNKINKVPMDGTLTIYNLCPKMGTVV
ncbi:MAG: hypothetical protein FWD76_01655 [Firmicutes bacterium]|nr:hypothetical protein [Bacillota bacterium]